MGPEVVGAWISDQHVLLHACSDPDACRLPPSPAKRRRATLADVDPSYDRTMSGSPELLASFTAKLSASD